MATYNISRIFSTNKNWKISTDYYYFWRWNLSCKRFLPLLIRPFSICWKLVQKKRGRLSKTRIRLVIVSSDKPISPCQSLLHSHCRSPKGKQLLFYLPNKRYWIFFFSLFPFWGKRSWKYLIFFFIDFILLSFFPILCIPLSLTLSGMGLESKKNAHL